MSVRKNCVARLKAAKRKQTTKKKSVTQLPKTVQVTRRKVTSVFKEASVKKYVGLPVKEKDRKPTDLTKKINPCPCCGAILVHKDSCSTVEGSYKGKARRTPYVNHPLT